ncbi:hypothetical protein [Kaistella polysaccharea]|uniref:hypothetical protein n=1 Tax=Kaistella polysaccharea TaxID=2878534 RepID=UPI001CF1A969|nr:hypothetical protein [Kaistella polysaccharea]
MKRVTLTLFVIFSNFIFAQTEQISLDYFASKILPKIKKSVIYYDGNVINKSSYEPISKNEGEETIIEIILWDYKTCKNSSNNYTFNIDKNYDFKTMLTYANVKNSKLTTLRIPENIKFRKTLKTKERKAGIFRYKVNKIFSQKYNLKVSSSIQIAEDIYLTRIFMTKQDYEHGNNFDIIVKNGQVIDYCNSYWIQ